MARIKTYPIDTEVSENDIVIGSDGENSSATRNYRMKAIKDYIVNGLPQNNLSLQDVITVNKRGDEVEFIYSLTDGVRLRGGYTYIQDYHADTIDTTKYYVYGDFETADGEIKRDIIRLNADNSLDTTFVTGTGTNQGSYPYSGSQFYVDANGKIYISGSFTSFNGVPANRIISLNNDGSVNTDFVYGSGFNNFTLANTPNKANTHIYITGLFTTYNGLSSIRFAKIALDGTLDVTFALGSSFNNTTVGVYVENDESIFVTGYFTTYKGVSANKLAKILPNGDRDVTFQVGSGFNTGNDQPNKLFRNSDGILIAYGYFTAYNGTPSNRIIALNDDGTINNTYDFGTGFSDVVINIVEKPTGGYYIFTSGTLYNGQSITNLIEVDAAFQFVRSLSNIIYLVGDSIAQKGLVFSTDEDGQYFTPMDLTATYGRVANKLTFSKTTGTAEYLIGDLEEIQPDELMPRRLIEELIIPQVNTDWDSVSGLSELLNKPDIIASITGTAVDNTDPLNPIVNSTDTTGFVPYVGAVLDVDLGLHKITLGLLVENAGVNKNEHLLGSTFAGNPVLITQPYWWNTNVSQYYSDTSYGFGAQALSQNKAPGCIAIGGNALWFNTGYNSTGIGSQALANNKGNYVTGIGYLAANENEGANTIGVGRWAARSNLGDNSTGVGLDAISQNTEKDTNGYGVRVLNFNLGEDSNAFGYESAIRNIGLRASGFGHSTLNSNQGNNNTALGHLAHDFQDNIAGIKTFDGTAANGGTYRITIPTHGFGTTGTWVNLRFNQGTAPLGSLLDNSLHQMKIIDVNTLSFVEVQQGSIYHGNYIYLDTNGTGHTFTPQFVYSNTTVLGANSQPTKSNQVVLGDSLVTEVFTYGKIEASGFTVSALNTAPASATDVGNLGEIRVTATAIYVCIATNTWVRSVLATW